MRNRLSVIGLVIVLNFGAVGCAVVDAPPISGTGIVDTSIATVENSFTLALIGAKIYTDLPRCKVSGPKICSETEVVRLIRRYAIRAHDAILAARQNQQLIGFAVGAVKDFGFMVPKT